MLARLLQKRRGHFVGVVLLAFRLVALVADRHLQKSFGHRRIVRETVEVDDQHLTLDDADELVGLGIGDRAWRWRLKPRLLRPSDHGRGPGPRWLAEG